MNLLDQAKRYAGGISVLQEWLGGDMQIVPQEEAQSRTDICNACPNNQLGNTLTEITAKAIKTQMELKNKLGFRTNGIKSLKTCQTCLCHLPLKIWVPKEMLMRSEDEQSLKEYHENCWMRKP